MPRPRFQFRLRTLFAATTAWAVLLAQWPLIERRPVEFTTLGRNLYGGQYSGPSVALVRLDDYEPDGHYFVPTRVVVVSSIEGAALIGWLVWRRLRRAATRD